ncbi:MAG: signal peptidase I [Parcubacteria group bacterium]
MSEDLLKNGPDLSGLGAYSDGDTPTGTPEAGPPDEEFLKDDFTTGYKSLAFIWEIIKIVIIALVIIIPIRYFIIQPFYVKGASMEENFHDGDYIIINEFSYRFTDDEPERGDVVIFRFPEDPKNFFIKRIIGLPSETIEIKDNNVTIYNTLHPEGVTLDESSYLSPDQQTIGNLLTKLDPNEYYVLGDNRRHSSDSRFWGPVNESLITGEVWFRAWPLNAISGFDTPDYDI